MKKLAPLIFVIALILLSTFFDGINAYDIPLPLGWLSDPSTPTLNAGCVMPHQ